MNAASRKSQRAPGQTTITFSCSSELKEEIRQAAEADRRSISNWIACRLAEAVRLTERATSPGSALRAAEHHAGYDAAVSGAARARKEASTGSSGT